jgi:uncharacterized protein
MIAREPGVGLVYWPALEPLFQDRNLPITSLEVEVEAFWLQTDDPSRPYRPDARALERIAALPQQKVVHGVGFPLGSCRPPDPTRLAPLRQCFDHLGPAWYSEHLAFNRIRADDGEHATGFLLPPLHTEAGARAAARTIRQTRAELGLPVAVETGVNYLRRQPWQLSDGRFVAQVSELADCDILLDLHNVWTNARNGGQDVKAFLAELPPLRIREIHLACGLEYQGYWVDAHSGLVPEEVLELARDVIPRLPNLGAVHIEILPQFLPFVDQERLREQIVQVDALWQTRGTLADNWFTVDTGTLPRPATRSPNCSPEDWEDTLGALTLGRQPALNHAWARDLTRDPGVALFRDLARTFRAGVVTDLLRMSSRLLMLTLGKDGVRRLLNAYWQEHPPEPLAAAECRGFARWLGQTLPEHQRLRALIDYDLALMALAEDNRSRIVRFDCEPMALLEALGRGELPGDLEPADYELLLV